MKRATILVWVMTKKGNQFEVSLPAKREVCPRCDGTGSHVNPSIDGNGLSSEDMGDSDFMESYLSGSYDVRCETCNGENVVSVLDFDALTPKMLDRLERQELQEHRDRTIEQGERKWRC